MFDPFNCKHYRGAMFGNKQLEKLKRTTNKTACSAKSGID